MDSNRLAALQVGCGGSDELLAVRRLQRRCRLSGDALKKTLHVAVNPSQPSDGDDSFNSAQRVLKSTTFGAHQLSYLHANVGARSDSRAGETHICHQ